MLTFSDMMNYNCNDTYPLSHISQKSILSSSAGSWHCAHVLQSVHCQAYARMWGTMSRVKSIQEGWTLPLQVPHWMSTSGRLLLFRWFRHILHLISGWIASSMSTSSIVDCEPSVSCVPSLDDELRKWEKNFLQNLYDARRTVEWVSLPPIYEWCPTYFYNFHSESKSLYAPGVVGRGVTVTVALGTFGLAVELPLVRTHWSI